LNSIKNIVIVTPVQSSQLQHLQMGISLPFKGRVQGGDHSNKVVEG